MEKKILGARGQRMGGIIWKLYLKEIDGKTEVILDLAAPEEIEEELK